MVNEKLKLTINIDDYLFRRMERACECLGLSIDKYMIMLIEDNCRQVLKNHKDQTKLDKWIK